MTTIEKPLSKKAKSFNRFSGTQDHGEAASEKIRRYYRDPSEEAWEHRGEINADKVHLFEDIREGLDEYYGRMTSYELEQEANKLLAATNQKEAAMQSLETYQEAVHEAVIGDDDRLTRLLAQFEAAYKRRVELVIDRGIANLSEEERQELKALDDELESIDDEITEKLRDEDRAPTIEEYEGRSDKEIQKSMARAATLDTFDDDDFGDRNDSHIKISNRPR